MCGRFAAWISGTEQLLEQFLPNIPALEIIPRYNVAPGDQVLCILQGADGQRSAEYLRWGFIPAWAQSKTAGPQINARSETAAKNSVFSSALCTRRCVIPISGFYEWRRAGKTRQAYYIYLSSGEPMALAGIWEERRSAQGQVTRSFAILTTAANELVRPIHDRMPVLLDAAGVELWLDHSAFHLPLLTSLMQPFPAEEMSSHPVSSFVNTAGNEGPQCIVPVPGPNPLPI